MKHFIIYYETGYYVINIIKAQLIKWYFWYIGFQEQAETKYPQINAYPENNKSVSVMSLYKVNGKRKKASDSSTCHKCTFEQAKLWCIS